MGNTLFRMFSGLQELFRGERECRLLMLGLDAAGKTTTLYQFKMGEVITTIPTIGFNVETLKYRGLSVTLWDVGGQDRIRPLWAHYFSNTQGLVFVVDSTDAERMEEAREELMAILSSPDMDGVPLLIYANKQDMPKALSTTQVSEGLRLFDLKNRQWYCQGACATQGTGIYEGLDWMATTVLKRK